MLFHQSFCYFIISWLYWGTIFLLSYIEFRSLHFKKVFCRFSFYVFLRRFSFYCKSFTIVDGSQKYPNNLILHDLFVYIFITASRNKLIFMWSISQWSNDICCCHCYVSGSYMYSYTYIIYMAIRSYIIYIVAAIFPVPSNV